MSKHLTPWQAAIVRELLDGGRVRAKEGSRARVVNARGRVLRAPVSPGTLASLVALGAVRAVPHGPPGYPAHDDVTPTTWYGPTAEAERLRAEFDARRG